MTQPRILCPLLSCVRDETTRTSVYPLPSVHLSFTVVSYQVRNNPFDVPYYPRHLSVDCVTPSPLLPHQSFSKDLLHYRFYSVIYSWTPRFTSSYKTRLTRRTRFRDSVLFSTKPSLHELSSRTEFTAHSYSQYSVNSLSTRSTRNSATIPFGNV